MSKYTRRLGAPAFIVIVSLLGACSSGEKKGPDSLALGADSTLNKDLAMANRDSTSEPQLKDVPATTPATPAATPAPTTTTPSRPERRPSRPEPRPERRPERRASEPAPLPAPEPTGPVTTPSGNIRTTNPAGHAGENGGGDVGTIAAGSTLNASAGSKICTNTNAVGDHVTATLESSVQGSNGAMIPAGATLNMTVTQLKKSANSNDKIVMEFAVNSVSFGGRTYPIDASVQSASVTRVRDEPQSKDVEKVAAGAVIGAIAGHILGRSTKGTVIGGAVGAAGGAAAAQATASYQGCIDQGSSIVVRLNSPATIRA